MQLTIRKLEDLTPFEKLALADFSYSRLDTYKMCPSKYFYTYIQKEPRLFGEAAVLGNIVHSVLEENVSATETLDYKKLQEAYVAQRGSYDPTSKIKDELITAGKEIIDEFYDQYGGTTFDVLHKEYGFKFVLGSYLITGYIDRIDTYGKDAVKIIDYKTGKWEISPKDIPGNLQLGIYAVAVKELYPDKDVYAELYYLRSGRRKGHLFTADVIEGVKANLISVLDGIINDTSYHPTQNTRVCTFCDFAKSGACPTGVFRARKLAKA